MERKEFVRAPTILCLIVETAKALKSPSQISNYEYSVGSIIPPNLPPLKKDINKH